MFPTDEYKFACDANNIEHDAIKYIKKWFGSRCEEFEPECECCKRWKALDNLIENPFEE